MSLPGIDGYGASGISGPRLDSWTSIGPPAPKEIAQSAKDNHGTNHQRAWTRPETEETHNDEVDAGKHVVYGAKYAGDTPWAP